MPRLRKREAAFASSFAEIYDVMYAYKTSWECDVLERMFHEHSGVAVRRVLDVGCGTGGHLRELAERGYRITGIDLSSAMLRKAREKIAVSPARRRVRIVRGDIRTAKLGRGFDAAIMMFAVLGYLERDEDVLRTLRSVRRHLRTGGLLLFDVWYGPAVLHQRARRTVRRAVVGDREVIRDAWTRVDLRRRVCHIRFRFRSYHGRRLIRSAREVHRMRFYFPEELERFIRESGFAPVRMRAFPEVRRRPNRASRYVFVVARATDHSDRTKTEIAGPKSSARSRK